MPILYESVFPAKVKRLKRKYRPKSLQQVAEAPRWRVVEEYAVSSIYMTSDQLIRKVHDALVEGCEEKGATLESWKVLDAWAVWKGLYTDYHIKYEAIIKGSPISQAVVILILAIVLTIVVIFAIWLVKRYIIEPIFEPIPPEWRPIVGTTIAIGVGLLLIGGGIYLATRWMKKK